MPPVPPTKESLTADLNKAQELLNQKKATMAPVQPTVSANDLATPTAPVQLPQPTQPTIPGRTTSTVANVLNQTRANSENFKRIQEEQAAFGSFADGQSGFDIQNEQLKRFGVTPEKLKELEDIQLQLSDRGTQSELTKTRIEGAAGQTLGQGQREVTQEDREAAVRDAGLASRAAVLQGNIETGRALANDAVNIALQDRTFQANAKIKQIEYLQGLVDQETSAALEDEKRKYTEELTAIQEVKDAVSEAMVNGASQSEIARLTDPNIDDQTKLALAQSITARGSNEMRNLEIASKSASIRASNLSSQKAQKEIEMLNNTYSGDFSNALDAASNLVGAERGKTSRVAIGNALNNGDYATAYALMANNVEESLTGEVKTKFANARTDYQVMLGMRDAIQEAQNAGVDTSFLSGTTEQIARRFGELKSDPAFATLAVQLEREFQSYRQNMTGAAFSPAESREYASVNPRTSASMDLNLATIDGALNQLENRIVSTVNTRIPGADKVYQAVSGGVVTGDVNPDEVEIGSTVEIGGVRYKKVGDDQYEQI